MPKSAFSKNIIKTVPSDVLGVLETLQNAGFEAYLVGGCVRDCVLGARPKDWDITTSALPIETKALFKKTFDTGIKHGTVTVLSPTPVEVTTFRTEGAYSDNRRPDNVSFTTDIRSDLARRDFTINALAWSPSTGILDPFHGLDDLKAKIIRTVGSPQERFGEDALRILRAIRFAAVLDFEIETETKHAIKALFPTIANISGERIRDELCKILVSKSPDASEPQLHLYLKLAAALSDHGPDGAREIMRNLRFDNKSIHHVTSILKYRDLEIPTTEAEVRKHLNLMGLDLYKLFIEFRLAECAGKSDAQKISEQWPLFDKVISENQCYSLEQLSLNGQDLVALGFKGPQIGQTLQNLLIRVLDDPSLNEKSKLLRLISY